MTALPKSNAPQADGISRIEEAQPPRLHAAQPEIAVLVSSYDKPEHLKRVLISLAVQERVRGSMEVVVTDDGSAPDTLQMVKKFAKDAPFPLQLTTHPHEGFQLARCRNDGVRASRAPYILFLDGDCVVPPDHIWQHLEGRRTGWAMGGYCCRLDEATSEQIDGRAIESGQFVEWSPANELKRLAKRHRKARLYSMLRHPGKPKLAGGNVGIWRDDYVGINGYDEKFVGWGGEDDDLRRRLVSRGLRIGSILHRTHTYHLWHPPAPTHANSYWDGVNVQYLHRGGRLSCCRHGLQERPFSSIEMELVGQPYVERMARSWLACHAPQGLSNGKSGSAPSKPAEVEILFWPGRGRFSGRADCNVLICFDGGGRRIPRRLRRSAHLILCDDQVPGFEKNSTQFCMDSAERLLAAIC